MYPGQYNTATNHMMGAMGISNLLPHNNLAGAIEDIDEDEDEDEDDGTFMYVINICAQIICIYKHICICH
jgi:hypothetical protein